MEKVTNSEELQQRLSQSAGEEVLHSGWGTLGMKNVFAGVTPSALVLEFISLGMKTLEVRRIPFNELEFIYAAKGDASTPGFLKVNVQAGIEHAMTGTLVFRATTGKLTYISFRKMPRHDSNDRAPFRMTEFIASVKPEIVRQPDLKQYREKQTFGGCLRMFAIIGGISASALFLALGFGTGEWDMAMYGGIGTGLVLGGIFAPLVPVFKRMIKGQG